MNYKQAIILLMPLLILSATACKKKSNSNPFGSSKIATISAAEGGGTLLYRIVYDEYNNVDSIVIEGSGYTRYNVFKYFASSYTVTNQDNNSFTVTTDANGNIEKIYVADTTTLSYNGSEVADLSVWMPQATYPYYAIQQIYYSWQGGNVISVASGATAYTYDYDHTKAGQPGDAWRLPQFLAYGRSYIKTTQLPIDIMSSGNWVEKDSYLTDGSGRITQFTKVLNSNGVGVNDTTVYSYTYYN